jgi:hypothetical protein
LGAVRGLKPQRPKTKAGADWKRIAKLVNWLRF